MLTCITCAKQRTETQDTEESARRTPTPTKEAVKSLGAQVKDMALKFSGVYRQCNPCSGSTGFKKAGARSYPEFDNSHTAAVPKPSQSSVSSISAWDFPIKAHNPTLRSDSGFIGLCGDVNRTPGVSDSISAQYGVVVVDEEEEGELKEWIAHVEPGIQITFASLPHGGNDLRRIRFNREMFDRWQAQRWWSHNYDRIMELYNVQRFNQLPANSVSEDGRDSSHSRLSNARESFITNPPLHREGNPESTDALSDQYYENKYYNARSNSYAASTPNCMPSLLDASRTTTSSRDEASISISNASEMEAEWVEQDEDGVYITIRQFADGTRELRRIRFSREMFGEVNAKLWWDENRERILTQYL